MSAATSSAAARFAALHRSGCFVLPNPWDVGSATYLHKLGYQALATTSAGFAFARGLPDAVGALTLDELDGSVKDGDVSLRCDRSGERVGRR